MNLHSPQAPPSTFAFKVEECVDDCGRRLVIRTVLFGEAPVGFDRFVGMNTVLLQLQTPEGVRHEPSHYQFPIVAETIEEAFAGWSAAAETFAHKHVEQLKQQMRAQAQQPSLVVARDMPPLPRKSGLIT